MISVQVRVPAGTRGRYGDLLERMLEAADEGGHQEPSDHTRLEWRVESTPSSDRRRQRLRFREWDRQLREELGRSPPREEDRKSVV